MSDSVEMTFDEDSEVVLTSPIPPESEISTAELIVGNASTVEQSVRALPKKVKHPSSSWMIFSTENREKIQKEQPSMTFTEGDFSHACVLLFPPYTQRSSFRCSLIECVQIESVFSVYIASLRSRCDCYSSSLVFGPLE